MIVPWSVGQSHQGAGPGGQDVESAAGPNFPAQAFSHDFHTLSDFRLGQRSDA